MFNCTEFLCKHFLDCGNQCNNTDDECHSCYNCIKPGINECPLSKDKTTEE